MVGGLQTITKNEWLIAKRAYLSQARSFYAKKLC
jgi:hypothetical protein